MAAFEEYWESGCAKLGFQGCCGWKYWVQNKDQTPAQNFSSTGIILVVMSLKPLIQVNLARYVVSTDKNTCKYWYFSLKINNAKLLKKCHCIN